jgi:hypothetical protein
MTNQQYKDEIYLALIKLLMQNSASESNMSITDGRGNVIQPKKSQGEINREADRMVTCMKLDRLNAEELQLVLDWYKNPTESNAIMTDPFKYRIVMDFIKKYPNVITENDPCDTTDYSKEAAIKKLKESMSNGTPDVLPPNTGGIKPPPPPIPTKTKIPFIPIAIGLVVVLGVIIYIKKAK